MMKTTISEIMGWSWSCSDDLTAANQDRQAWDGGNQPTQKLPWHGGKNENIRILNVPETPGSRSPTAVSKLLKETELGQRRSDRSVTQGSPHKEARWCHCGESTLLSRQCRSPSPCQGVQSSPVQRNRHLLIPRLLLHKPDLHSVKSSDCSVDEMAFTMAFPIQHDSKTTVLKPRESESLCENQNPTRSTKWLTMISVRVI